MKLGKLKKLDLRSQWPHEALNFTRWQPLPGKKACRVRLFRPFDDGVANWEEGYAWLISTGQKFKSVFARDWD